MAAIEGVFWATISPAKYQLHGYDGNALCPPVSVTVTSGLYVNAPPIECQGM